MNTRLKYIDTSFAKKVLLDFERSRDKVLQLIEQEPGVLAQTRYHSLWSNCKHIALYYYALGYPFDRVRAMFSEASEAILKVFELRGTEESFPVTILTVDCAKPPRESLRIVGERPLSPPGVKDFSVTNSKTAFEGICGAFTARDHSAALRLAELMWDPPKANYVGPRSEVCTYNDQRLAYAVKSLLKGNGEAVEAELAQIKALNVRQDPIILLTNLVRTLSRKDVPTFLTVLQDRLNWHQEAATKPANHRRSEFYLDLYAIGLSAIAVRMGLIDKNNFFQENVYMPLKAVF